MDDFNEVMIKAQQAAEELHNAIAIVLDAWTQTVSKILDEIADVLDPCVHQKNKKLPCIRQ